MRIEILGNKEGLKKKLIHSIRQDTSTLPYFDFTLGGQFIGNLSIARAFATSCIYHRLPKKFHKDPTFIFKNKGDAKGTNKYRLDMGYHLMNKYRMTPSDAKIELSKIMAGMTEYLYSIDGHVNLDFGLFDIIELADLDDGILEMLIKPVLNNDDTPGEVDAKRKYSLKHMEEVVMEHKIEPLYTLMTAGSGLRIPQLVDVCCGIFWRPDGDEAMPYLLRESWLSGLRSKESFFVEHVIGRNAIILSKLCIEDTGVFGKYSSLNNQSNYFHKNPDYVCNTKTFDKVKVGTQEEVLDFYLKSKHSSEKPKYKMATIKELEGRYMQVEGKPVQIGLNDNLMGQTIDLRTPKFCNCPDGVCKYCATERLYNWNKYGDYIQRNVGVQISKDASADPGQSFLSAKHHQLLILGKYTFIIHHDGDELKTKEELEAIFEEKFGKIALKKKYKKVFSVSAEYNKQKRRLEADAIFIEDENMTISIPGSCFIFDALEQVDEVYSLIEDPSEIRYKIPHQQLGNDFKTLERVFGSKDEMSIEEKEREIARVMKGRPPIVSEFLIRGLLFTKDELGDYMKPDFSDPSAVNSMTMLKLEDAIKNSESLAIRLQMGWFIEIITDPRMYDADYLKPNTTDLYFSNMGSLQEDKEE